MKRLTYTILVTIFSFHLAFAGNGTLEIANDLFNRLAFTKAATYYEKYLKKNEDDVKAWAKLAQCYNLTNAYEDQINILADLVKRENLKDSTVYLEYAKVLHITRNFEEAVKWYEKYLTYKPEDRRAINQLEVAKVSVGKVEDMQRFIITSMPFNSEAFEYSPNFLNGTLLYTSTSKAGNVSPKITSWTGGTYSDLRQFETQKNDAFIGQNEIDKINTQFNDGPFTVDPKNGQFYYTRNNFDINKTFNKVGLNSENYMNLKIYIADQDYGKIGEIKEFEYNFQDYNTGHPTISYDGKTLVFVADQPVNAVGQRDLYFSTREDENAAWKAPQILTTEINTEGDELFPHFHEDGSLYFSSDGLGSYGGLDIFKAKIDFENNELIELEHLEGPMNSTYDDFSIIFTNAREGYFTSDRPTGKGKDDIYAFKDNSILIKGRVVDSESGKIIPTALASVKNKEKVLFDDKVNEEARFKVWVEREQTYNVFADAEGYHEDSKLVSTADNEGIDSIDVLLKLKPIKYLVRVVNKVSGFPVNGATIDLAFNCNKESENYITGSNGTHPIPIYKECGYKFKVKAEGYFAENVEWTAPLLDSDETVIIYLNEITFEPIVLNDIYYDFNKADLRMEESAADLNKLLEFFRDNPELTVKLIAHTDSRGSIDYNIKLSQARAQSVVNFLLANNIPKEKMLAAGFGEAMPVNKCVDGVQCTEEEHQLNRRTEFQVINVDGSTKVKSNARSDIDVVPCQGCPF